MRNSGSHQLASSQNKAWVYDKLTKWNQEGVDQVISFKASLDYKQSLYKKNNQGVLDQNIFTDWQP